MAPKKPQPPSEADIIFNRANVALARSRALIQSWLPAPSAAEQANSHKTDEELLKEDEELFKATPELLGVGAILPDSDQDSLVKRRGPSNQKLLEQLLGKKAANKHIASKTPNRFAKVQSTTAQATKGASADDDNDEEEGRASMVASKRKRPGQKPQMTNVKPDVKDGADDKEETQTGKDGGKSSTPARADSSEEEDARPGKRRGGSYLDQLLAEKANKKKKKKQKAAAK
ncbi:hypothetical protein AAFC00_007219 [Neodothiora populina]|uniref:Uncharacterized protein n=1 Tax=Neodothiora populina TaxID=2781224 RepID=A0ABR3PHY6_9PEZI